MRVDELLAGLRAGSARAIARLITLLESEHPDAAPALRALHAERRGEAHIVGVTGAPGTGKSTLVDRLVAQARRDGRKVGVVAVDPSSPFTGGAILGDRIRMQSHAADRDVFIRSMGTRGALGGLSGHTLDAVRVLEAAGKDVIFVETVGVGQAEVDVARLADTVLVVLVPNLGDDVQAVKAGIMEIADVFVVNKADLAGADKVGAEVEASLMLAMPAPVPSGEPWTPPIARTVAESGQGVAELAAAVARHRQWSEASGAWGRRRAHRAREQLRSALQKAVLDRAFQRDGAPRPPFAALVADVEAGNVLPLDAAQRILAALQGVPAR